MYVCKVFKKKHGCTSPNSLEVYTEKRRLKELSASTSKHGVNVSPSSFQVPGLGHLSRADVVRRVRRGGRGRRARVLPGLGRAARAAGAAARARLARLQQLHAAHAAARAGLRQLRSVRHAARPTDTRHVSDRNLTRFLLQFRPR